jgi:hypothetical protein
MQGEARLEDPVPVEPEAEHVPAQRGAVRSEEVRGGRQRGTLYVLHDPRQTGPHQQGPRRGDEIWIFVCQPRPAVAHRGEPLARRRGVDGVELVRIGRQVLERVGLVELERVAGLPADVHADDIEPSAVVAHASATGAAEQVEQSGPHGCRHPHVHR